MEKYNDEALNSLLSEITPAEQAKTDAKMLIALKIADAMQAKGWNKTRLMKEMGKTNPSEITRWLSGTQNFTVETLVDLEQVLEIKLLDLGESKNAEIIM
jgi:ribosome-binding protein aMBF1 (putative translation factor)